MRKYKRMLIRAQAERLRLRHPSKYVHNEWAKYQVDKYGLNAVAANKARGTHKKDLWKDRVSTALYNVKKGRLAV